MIEPKLADEGSNNVDNDVPSTSSENIIQGEEKNHRIDLEHWGHYNPRLRINQFLDREIIGLLYPSNEATYGWDSLSTYMMRFPAVSRSSG